MFLFTLIKSGSVHTADGQKVIPKDAFSQLMQAKEIVELAQKEREELLESTRQECETLKKQAEAQGFQKGLELLNDQIVGLESSIKTNRHELQKQILPLALKASKRIVGEELSINPDAIINIIQQAIKPITTHTTVKIYVNKEDLVRVLKERDHIKSRFEKLESLTIEEREDVEQGSCIIETEVGIINATLDNQWRALEAAFESYMKKQ